MNIDQAKEVCLSSDQAEQQRMRFEVGYHIPPTDVQAKNALVDRFYRGDPNAHMWNKDVEKRIAENPPKLLAIDGLGLKTKIWTKQDLSGIYVETKYPPPEDVWLFLPGQPAKISKSSPLFVLAGDSFNVQGTLNLTSKLSAEHQLYEEIEKRISSDLQRTKLDLFWENYLLSGFIATMDLIILGKRLMDVIAENPKMTRRQFFKGAAVGIGTLTGSLIYDVVRYQAPIQAAFSSTEEEKDFYLQLASLARPLFFTSDYVDARTALVAIKTMDGAKDLQIPPSDTLQLWGAHHAYRFPDISENPSKRERMIKDYLIGLLKIVDYYYTSKEMRPQISREAVVKQIKDFLASYALYRVYQPDKNTFYTEGLADDVKKSMIYEYKTSPSVLKALEQIK